MDFLPSIDRMVDVIVSRIRGSEHMQGLDVRVGGAIWQLANAFAREGRNIAVRLADAVLTNSFPGTATGPALLRWANALLRGGALPGSAAAGVAWIYADLNTATQLSGSTITSAAGLQYRTTSDALPAGWAAFGAAYRQMVTIEAVDVGTVYNLATPATLTLQTPGADIQEDMALVAWTTFGTDPEDEQQLQRRVLQRLRDAPGGGSCADYRAWALEVDGVYDAFVYPIWGAPGDMLTVAVRLYGPPGNRRYELDPDGGAARTAEIVAAVTDLIESRQPPFITLESCAFPGTTPVSISLEVGQAPGFEPDWLVSSFGAAPVTTSWTAATLTVGISQDPAGIIEPGARVVLLHEPMNRSEEYTVINTVSGGVGPWSLTLDHGPPAGQNIEIGPDILPGGPLYAPVRAAIDAVLDACGPSDIVDGGYPTIHRWPLVNAEYPSALWSSNLVFAAENVPGVPWCDLIAPVFPGLANDVLVAGAPVIWLAQGGWTGAVWDFDVRIAWE